MYILNVQSKKFNLDIYLHGFESHPCFIAKSKQPKIINLFLYGPNRPIPDRETGRQETDFSKYKKIAIT